jgi:hypothetical protein
MTMAIDRAQLIRLIEGELAHIKDARWRARIRDALVEPVFMHCAWDYGSPGETYPCWKVLEEPHPGSAGIVYCEQGFGPKCPWGLVWLREAVPTMGQDSSWFPSLSEAAADLLDMPPSSPPG